MNTVHYIEEGLRAIPWTDYVFSSGSVQNNINNIELKTEGSRGNITASIATSDYLDFNKINKLFWDIEVAILGANHTIIRLIDHQNQYTNLFKITSTLARSTIEIDVKDIVGLFKIEIQTHRTYGSGEGGVSNSKTYALYGIGEGDKYLLQDGEEIKTYGLFLSEPPSSVETVTASSTLEGYPTSNLLDGNENTEWQSGGSYNQWLLFKLTTPYAIKHLIATSGTKGGDAPDHFSIHGSMDGVTFDLLHTAPGVAFDNAARNTKEFHFDNETAYAYYRINVSAGTSYTRIAEINLFPAVETLGWQTIGTAPVTKEMFDNHGMTDLSLLDSDAIGSLSSATPEVLCWTDEESTVSEYTEDLVPAMTSNNIPSPIVISASGSVSGYEPWKAFNNSINSSEGWIVSKGLAWIKIDFGEEMQVVRYTFRDGSGVQQNPQSWLLEGSKDNNTWVKLDERSGESNWGKFEQRVYSFSNAASFRYYRFTFSANNGDSHHMRIGEIELMGALSTTKPSRTAHLTAIPHPQLLLPVEDIEVGEMESVKVEATALESIKLLVSGDSGVTWKGKTVVDPADLESVKANGFPVVEFNALTKEELADLFPNGKARFAFYLEQESSADTVELHSLTINEKQYTMTPSLENLSVIYELLESESPSLHVSRDDGVTWKEVQADQLTKLDDLPEGKALRVKAVLQDGQELHGLSYSWI